jgi:hypothetical protein
VTVRSGAARSGTTAAVTALDMADLVVIAERVLGVGTDVVLAQMDVPAAGAALAEAGLAGDALAGDQITDTALADADAVLAPALLSGVPLAGAPLPAAAPRVGPLRDRADAAAAGIGLVHALLRHRPFPRQCEQVAITAGLQFLSLNGWRADLNPPAPAAVVVEALASGQLSPAAAAAWLSPRLTRLTRAGRPVPPPRPQPRLPRARLPRAPLPRTRPLAPRRAAKSRPATRVPVRRTIASALLALAIGGISLLAAACSRAPAPAPTAPAPTATASPFARSGTP